MSGDEKGVVMMGAPQGSAPMTTTVINIHSEPPMRDHVIWSLFNTLFMNWCCLGFVAFAFSVKSRDRKMVGDMTGARSYASTARSLNIAALVLGVVLTIVVIAVYASTIGFIFFQIKSQQRGYS
ncbi:interferon-induced transmembrane protein 1-like [Equus przewalskii]|uniref:Interferon-induced transmembrane protein 1-like n=1 Tax=Equus przewalskii TaxID=9798 RepID=A0ABM4JXK6_EQUPR|nr:interferon-induced transmembrane protein 1 [Equus caballus]